MNKAPCEVRSSARGSNLLPSPIQSQASSAVISCSTSVQHNPSNVNSTSTTTPDSGLKSEPKLEHQKPKSEPRKKVQFSQEEVEDDLWPTELLLSESEGGLIMDSSWSMVSACQLESDTNKPGMFPSLFTLRQGPCRVSVLGRQRSVYSLFKRDHTN